MPSGEVCPRPKRPVLSGSGSEPLYHVARHSQDRPHPKKGGPSASERDEFLRAAWRSMVAAEVDPERPIFVDARWEYIPRLRPFTVTPRRVSACALRSRATLRQERDAFGLDHPRLDGRDAMAVEGSTDRGVFEAYVEHALAPTLEAGGW